LENCRQLATNGEPGEGRRYVRPFWGGIGKGVGKVMDRSWRRDRIDYNDHLLRAQRRGGSRKSIRQKDKKSEAKKGKEGERERGEGHGKCSFLREVRHRRVSKGKDRGGGVILKRVARKEQPDKPAMMGRKAFRLWGGGHKGVDRRNIFGGPGDYDLANVLGAEKRLKAYQLRQK